MARSRQITVVAAACLVLFFVALTSPPAQAQNRKRSWEVFIYFGQYGGQQVPSAIQTGVVETYRLDPFRAQDDPNNPGSKFCEVCRNLGMTGPGAQFLGPLQPLGGSLVPDQVDPCHLGSPPVFPAATDRSTPYLDECDDDIEARYLYNAQGIKTNGAVQVDDTEFLLGARLGYNITNHWEVELDLGFAKQRLDMTRSLIPLLTEPVSNPADPFFNQLSKFFVFTWANFDFVDIGYKPAFSVSDPNTVLSITGAGEIPNVPHRRFSRNPNANIPAVLPMPFLESESFADVTEFINRIFLDPAAIRNRANQINIDIFAVGLSGVYNFNTKPDSRIVPYLQAGFGRWIRQFDAPYEGENTDYLSAGGGVRFFVNEIFSFRLEGRKVYFRDDTMTIKGNIPPQNLLDINAEATSSCQRDQDPPAQQPPRECSQNYLTEYAAGNRPSLPSGANPGGFAKLEIVTETDDFWEARIGFDILLGGR